MLCSESGPWQCLGRPSQRSAGGTPEKFKKRVRARWSDMITADQTERAHQMLGDVVEQNITRLNAKIEELDGDMREGPAACERAKLGWRPAGCGERPLFYEMPARAAGGFQMYHKIKNWKRGGEQSRTRRRGVWCRLRVRHRRLSQCHPERRRHLLHLAGRAGLARPHSPRRVPHRERRRVDRQRGSDIGGCQRGRNA